MMVCVYKGVVSGSRYAIYKKVIQYRGTAIYRTPIASGSEFLCSEEMSRTLRVYARAHNMYAQAFPYSWRRPVL